MATLTYLQEGCCCLFRILCSIICPHKLSIQRMTYSLAPKRLLFVSYKSQKRAAKYSQLFKQPSVNFNLLHNIVRICTQSHVCENPISSLVSRSYPGKARVLTTYTTFFSGIINARLRIIIDIASAL